MNIEHLKEKVLIGVSLVGAAACCATPYLAVQFGPEPKSHNINLITTDQVQNGINRNADGSNTVIARNITPPKPPVQ